MISLWKMMIGENNTRSGQVFGKFFMLLDIYL